MNSIINHILIPMPHMQDPYFNRSVVFMCEHNKDGAMGLIVNKPFSDPALKELFDSFYDDADEILKSVEQVYFGGPVMVERGIVLHSSHYQSEDSIKISNDFFLSSHKKTLEDLSKQNGDADFTRSCGLDIGTIGTKFYQYGGKNTFFGGFVKQHGDAEADFYSVMHFFLSLWT